MLDKLAHSNHSLPKPLGEVAVIVGLSWDSATVTTTILSKETVRN